MSISSRILMVALATASAASVHLAGQLAGQSPQAFPGPPKVPADGSCASPVPSRPGARQGIALPPCPVGLVTPPAGWYSGDTHEHAQLCFSTTLRSEEELRDELIARGENVANLLVWGARINSVQYLTSYLPLITGTEHPSTLAYPDQVVQYGVETSGFQCARLGHTIGLNVGAAQGNFFVIGGCPEDDQSGDFAAPVVDLFQQDPDAVIGYAHQTWPVPLYAPAGQGGFDWEEPSLPAFVGAGARCSAGKDLAFPDPTTTIIHPTLAAFDTATGRLDFIETVDLYADLSTTSLFQDRWYGLYYKLLSAGQQLSIAGGTDADCVGLRQSACEPRTWVKLPTGRGFDYSAWTEGLGGGRASVSDGGYQFLELQVGGLDPGARYYASSSAGVAQVPVVARYHLAQGVRHSDTLQLVQDGQVVHSAAMGQRRGGVFEVALNVPFTKSGWIAARTASGGTHTAAVYVIVDKKPIASCAEADYFTIYADYLSWLFDWAASLPDPSILDSWVGCSEAEIRQHIADGRKVFAAVRDYAAGTPSHVIRRGWSTPSDRGPMGMNIDGEPRAGTTRALNCFNTPPGALGALLVSPWFNPTPEVVLGAQLFVLGTAQGVPYLAFPRYSTKGGFAEVAVSLPAVLAGYDLFAQWVWYNPRGYDSLSVFSASDVLELRVR